MALYIKVGMKPAFILYCFDIVLPRELEYDIVYSYI